MNNNPLLLLFVLFASILTSCSSNEELIVEKPESAIIISSKPIENNILSIINDHRTSIGLPELKQLSAIKTQTQNHTNYMVSVNEVSHKNFYERKTYLTNTANAKSVAENVAYGYTTANSVVSAWLNSRSHKQNIEGDFNYFEVSAEKDADGKWYYTNIFIKK